MAVRAASTRSPARGPRVWWRGLPRGVRVALVAVALVLFVAISGLLARYLSADNLERNDDLALVRAEARGDLDAMLARLSGCRASVSCVGTARAARGARRPGRDAGAGGRRWSERLVRGDGARRRERPAGSPGRRGEAAATRIED